MISFVIKRCGNCGKFLSEDDFNWSNKKKKIRRSQCKKCSRNMSALWHEDNKEHQKQYNKQYQKQYRINNKDYIQNNQKQYRINNSEYNKQYQKQYYQNNKEHFKQWSINNKEKILKYNKQYKKDNPEKVAVNNIKYRLMKDDQTPELNKKEQNRIDKLYKICSHLNYDKIDFHVDHIQPLSKGGLHHPDNLQILPNWLNNEKYNKWPLTEQEQIKYEGFRI